MAITVYKKTALLGGAATALDGIDGAGLLDGDFAFVTLSGVLYVYILDDDEAGVESSPTRITPDVNPGNKRWILQETYLKGVTSSVAELNILTGVTASAAELNLLDTSVAGTAVASKALVLGADKNIDTISIAASGLKIGAGAGTAVTATAAEINKLAGLATTAAELGVLNGIPATLTATELGYCDGVTSAIQTQLNAKSIAPVVGYAEASDSHDFASINIDGVLSSATTTDGWYEISIGAVQKDINGGRTVAVDSKDTSGNTVVTVSLVLPAGTWTIFATGGRNYNGVASFWHHLTAMAIKQ